MKLPARRLLGAVKRRVLGGRPKAAPPDPRPTALRPALVIPVHNDADGLARLLAQAYSLGCFSQIIVVDDGSTPPISTPPVSTPPISTRPISTPPVTLPNPTIPTEITLLRHDHPKGGGVARNLGLTSVTAPHVLFFDADDLLTDDLPHLLTALGGAGPFDFCQFKYADSRVQSEGLRGHPDWDETFWEQAGLSVGHLRDAPPEAWPVLAKTANYPWNKIYRTAFLREHDIGCAATQVHQDIPLHWLGYLAATRILTSDRICAWHHVTAAGDRLTNRSGPERLEVFAALAPVMAVADTAGPAWQQALGAFVLGLIDWADTRIDPSLQPELRHKERTFLASNVGPWMAGIDAADPDLAAQIRQRMDATP